MNKEASVKWHYDHLIDNLKYYKLIPNGFKLDSFNPGDGKQYKLTSADGSVDYSPRLRAKEMKAFLSGFTAAIEWTCNR